MKMRFLRFSLAMLTTKVSGAAAAMRGGDLAGRGVRLLPLELGLQRHDDVQPLAARGLDVGREPQPFEELLHEERGVDDLLELDALAGVEVEDHPVGLFERGRASGSPRRGTR